MNRPDAEVQADAIEIVIKRHARLEEERDAAQKQLADLSPAPQNCGECPVEGRAYRLLQRLHDAVEWHADSDSKESRLRRSAEMDAARSFLVAPPEDCSECGRPKP